VSNFKEQIMMGKLFVKSKKFTYHLLFAENGIKRMLEIAPKSYISLSFGKQSNCLAHLIYQIDKTVPMFFLASEETWDMHNYRDVVSDFRKLCPDAKLNIIQTENFYSGEHKTWKESRDAGQFDLQRMCNPDEWDGWFWGLSTDESNMRRKTLLERNPGKQYHESIYQYSSGKYRCCPIMKWDILMLAAYIWLNDIPLLDVYKKYGLTQRTTARLTKKSIDNNSLGYIKSMGGQGYNKISNKFKVLNI